MTKTTTPAAGYPSAAQLNEFRAQVIADMEARLEALRAIPPRTEGATDAVLGVDDEDEQAAPKACQGDPVQACLLVGALIENLQAMRDDFNEGRRATEFDMDEQLTGHIWALKSCRAMMEGDILTPQESTRLRFEEGGDEDDEDEEEGIEVDADEVLAVEVPLTGSPGQCDDGPALRLFLFALLDALAAAEAMAAEHGGDCACWACTDARHSPYILEGIIRNLEGSIITLEDLRAAWEKSRGRKAVETHRASVPRPRVAVEA